MGLDKKKPLLIVVIIWFVTAACWIATFFIGVYSQSALGLIILRGVTALTSLATAIVNLIRYKRP